MARTPKNGKGGATHVTATTLILPGEGVLEGLSKLKRNTRKNVKNINDTFSTKFAKAVDEKHVDRRAANIAFNLDSLSDEQLHVTYYHLLSYLDDLGVTKRATEQEELFAAGETGPGVKAEGDDEPGKGRGNVRHIGEAARSVAERAGERAPG